MKKKGFTLIELLVVIAIIALLLSIMVPALNRARLLTRQLVCMARMRSLATAAMMYTSNNDGSLPLSGSRNARGELQGQYPYAPFWDIRLLPYLGIENVHMDYDPDGQSVMTGAQSDKLKPYSKALKVFLCPSMKATEKSAVTQIYRSDQYPKSYLINGYVSGIVFRNGVTDLNASYRRGSSKVSRIKHTSRTLLLMDVRMAIGDVVNSAHNWAARYWWDIRPAHFVKGVGPYDFDPSNTWNYWRYQETYGRSGFAFTDGHVESLKNQFTPGGNNNVRVGDPTPDAIPGVKLSPAYKW